MRCCHVLFAVGLLLLATAHAQTLEVFLVNITIFTSLEADPLVRANRPEVYLSCETERVDLDQVREVGTAYAFVDGINATSIGPGGCVDCSLRESDATDILEDDVFGEWTMCEDDFEETGFYEVEEEDQFYMRFECPSCQSLDVVVVEAAPFDEDADLLADSPSEPAISPEDDL